jgi:hypothetical protein
MSKVFNALRSLLGRPKPPKRDRFFAFVDSYRDRVAAWQDRREASGPRIGVLITPWLSTAVPFFSLECAEMLRRAGRSPVALFDATDVIQNSDDLTHSTAVERLVTECFSKMEIRKIADAGTQPSDRDPELAEPIFRENSIWRSRGEGRVDGFMAENANYRDRIINHLGRVRAFLSSARLDGLLIPGGIFGLSGLYVAIARELKLPFSTYDGGPGMLRLAQNGIAAHLFDIPDVFDQLRKTLTSEERAKLIQLGKSELEDRFHARDFRQFQVSAATGREDLRYDLFVPLNIRWDSAALNRQRAFASVAEWLDALLGWVAARPDVSICVRQHPRERLAFAKGSDDLGPLLARYAELGTRLRFVSAEEPLNSYDLMRHARAVLPHTSTVGIEAAVLGMPVILGTAVYYEDLGFCRKAATKEEYFTAIEDALAGRLAPTPEQREDAALAYYLTQRCAVMQTSFSPQPDDFRKWVKIPIEELWAQPEAADFRSAFLSGEPLSLIRHRRFLAEIDRPPSVA